MKIHMLKRLTNFLPFELKKTLVQSLLMPHFDYCDVIFTDLNARQTERLQRVHNACVRFICNIRKADHISPSFNMLSWFRLKERRAIHSLTLLYNILHTSTPVYLASRFQYLSSCHTKDTRSRHHTTLSIPLHRTSFYSLSFTISVAKLWNTLPQNVRDCQTLLQFKNKLERHFLANYLNI